MIEKQKEEDEEEQQQQNEHDRVYEKSLYLKHYSIWGIFI